MQIPLYRSRFALMLSAVACVLLLVSADAAAKTYYLAPNGSNSSSRNGSSAQPWKSLTYASGRMTSSDDLILKAGTYNYTGTQYFSRSGKSNNWITIRAANNAEVTLDFSGNRTQFTEAIRITGNYINFQNINVRNNSRGGGIEMSGHHVGINGCDVYNIGGSAIQAFGNTNNWSNTPNHITIAWCNVWNTCRMNDPNFWNYQGWADQGGFWPFAVGGRNARNVKVRNCWVGENFGEGICLNRVRGGNSEVKNCYTRDNYSVNIYIDSVRGDNGNWVDVVGNVSESTGKRKFYRDNYPAQNFTVASELYTDLTGNNFTNRVYFGGNSAVDGVNNYYVGDLGGNVSNVKFNNNTSTSPVYNDYLRDNSSKIWSINVRPTNSW
ncbi:MAG: hypothetical protein AAGL98_02965 [Planctomycetota bacterium]